MNDNSLVFAMANPTPEIMPDEAAEAGAAIIATGRSDFPNQINNALGFPGIFRGPARWADSQRPGRAQDRRGQGDCRLRQRPEPDGSWPSIFEDGLAMAVASAVRSVG